jgi:hypothetical protein
LIEAATEPGQDQVTGTNLSPMPDKHGVSIAQRRRHRVTAHPHALQAAEDIHVC